MKIVTFGGVRITMPPWGKTVKRTVKRTPDTPINLITWTGNDNSGRLAIDNELARIKYCV